jgi:hypothetical protein
VATGLNTVWFIAKTWRFVSSLGSLIGNDASLGVAAQPPTRMGNTHAVAHLTKT